MHGVHQLIQSVAGQGLEQIAVTHISRSQPVTLFLYIRYQVIEHRLPVIGRNHAQEQRQCIATLASRAILMRIRMIKLTMKRLIDFLTQTGIIIHIILIAYQLCSLHQVTHNHIIMCRSHQRNGSIARETCTEISIVIPVSQSERHDALIGTGSHIVHVSAHPVIIFPYQRIIAIRLIIHKGQHHKRTPPLRRFGKGIHAGAFKHYILRGCSGHCAIGVLCIGNVLQGLRDKARQIIIVEQSGTA